MPNYGLWEWLVLLIICGLPFLVGCFFLRPLNPYIRRLWAKLDTWLGPEDEQARDDD